MGPELEKDERDSSRDRQPQDLQDEGRTLDADERPVLEDLGTGEREPGEHGG